MIRRWIGAHGTGVEKMGLGAEVIVAGGSGFLGEGQNGRMLGVLKLVFL